MVPLASKGIQTAYRLETKIFINKLLHSEGGCKCTGSTEVSNKEDVRSSLKGLLACIFNQLLSIDMVVLTAAPILRNGDPLAESRSADLLTASP